MIRSRKNCEHYKWGDNCDGWHLVKSQSLSIIEEIMPPGTEEEKHYHATSQQFFRILCGTATFEIDDKVITVNSGTGIHVSPNTMHKIRNNGSENLEFIVISQPTTRGDRFTNDGV